MPSFATLRIAALLGVLIVVGFNSAHRATYSRNWNQPLSAVVYPINADGMASTDRYIQRLDDSDFKMINEWGVREAKRHGLTQRTPLMVKLGEQIDAIPPAFPTNASPLKTLLWGLGFRWWAFMNTPDSHEGLTQVRLFVLYYEGRENESLAHSLGMQKGLMGLVHVFADKRQNAQNNIIIAHELLHTVGAVDKYDRSGNPIFPSGYVDAKRRPLFPQTRAEIMTGRVPLAEHKSEMARSLRTVQINKHTAREINWLQAEED